MSLFSARRISTALTLATLLCASPVLAKAPARTAQRSHAVAAPTQLGVLDFFQNAIDHFIAKLTVGGSGSGTISGARIDPNGTPTGPPPPPTGTP